MRKTKKFQRTPEEDFARGTTRSLVRSLGARLRKVERTHVVVSPCDVWPEGLVTAFHGWVDLYARLIFCADNPHFVVGGIYVRGEEFVKSSYIKRLVDENDEYQVTV